MRYLIDTNIFFGTDRELIQQHITKTTTAYDKKRLKGIGKQYNHRPSSDVKQRKRKALRMRVVTNICDYYMEY